MILQYPISLPVFHYTFYLNAHYLYTMRPQSLVNGFGKLSSAGYFQLNVQDHFAYQVTRYCFVLSASDILCDFKRYAAVHGIFVLVLTNMAFPCQAHRK